MRAMPPMQRFVRYVIPTDSGCLLWTGATKNGYGYFNPGPPGGSVPAHRWLYEQTRGPVPKHLGLDHLCHSNDHACAGGVSCPHRRCVNVQHLEPVSTRINVLRGRSYQARVAVLTHCHRGHAFDAKNTYLLKGRWRQCRTCHNARHTARRRLRREDTCA